jgi:hypothetical protein
MPYKYNIAIVFLIILIVSSAGAEVTIDRCFEDLVAAYDGTALDTIYDAPYGREKVTLWHDQINDYDLVKGSSSYARCPVLLNVNTGSGEHPVLFFGGSIVHIYNWSFNLNLPNTFFIVMAMDSDLPAKATIFDGKQNNGDYRNSLAVNDTGNIEINAGTTVTGSDLSLFTNSFNVYCCEFSAGQSSVTIVTGINPDGTLELKQLASGDAGSESLKGLEVGCSWDAASDSFFRGKIAELLIYDDALAQNDRNYILEYLYDKYIKPPYISIDEFTTDANDWTVTTNADITYLQEPMDNGQYIGKCELYCHNKREPYRSQMQFDYSAAQNWQGIDPYYFRVRMNVLQLAQPGEFFIELNDGVNTQSASVFPDTETDGLIVAEIPVEAFDNIDFTNIQSVAVGTDYGDIGGNGHYEIDYIRLYPKTCENYPQADLTGDCRVDFNDFARFSENWLLPN